MTLITTGISLETVWILLPKLSSKSKWMGHPFYYDCLQTLEKLNLKLPESIYELLSTPIWYNKFLNTNFDCLLSKQGFNYVKDIVRDGELLNLHLLSNIQISNFKRTKIISIGEKLPSKYREIIAENKDCYVTPFPQTFLELGQCARFLKDINGQSVYNFLVKTKFQKPVGIHKWTNLYNLSEEQISNAFTFAHSCTLSSKARHFQYKICTFTLPTQEYLWNYQVKDNPYCSRCLSMPNSPRVERDTVHHNLYACPVIAPFLAKVLTFLVNECKASTNISESDYLLGIQAQKYQGLNCALLELKRYIFYNFSVERNLGLHFKIYENRLRRIILCDKRYHLRMNKYTIFYEKWKNFSPIYQIYGPDPLY